MPNETNKSNQRRKSQAIFQKIFSGKGIDIGCGTDKLTDGGYYPNVTSCEGFDLKDGDAQHINLYRPIESYDFVYSSNCLEHLDNPQEALLGWISIIKPGGYLVFTVPDEDLYEQGHWPPNGIQNINGRSLFTKIEHGAPNLSMSWTLLRIYHTK